MLEEGFKLDTVGCKITISKDIMLLIFYATVKKLTTLLLCPRITEEQSAAKLCFNYLCLRVEELKKGEDFFASPCLCRSTFSKERAIWSYMAGQRAALRTSRHQCVRVLCHGSVIWNVICINLFANSNDSVQQISMLVTLLLLSPFLFQAPSVNAKVSHNDDYIK